MEIGLHGETVRRWEKADGFHADVVVVEPNGDEYRVECLIRRDGGTDIGGNGDELYYLQERYGSSGFSTFVRGIALR